MVTNPKKRNKRRNPGKARRRNPVVIGGRKRSRRRNPAIAGYEPMMLLKLGGGAAAGAIGARAVTQLFLKDKNEGVMGYGANIVAAIGLGWLAGKMDKDIGLGVMAGGLGSTVQRIWNEKVSLTSAATALSGLGDVDYSDNGMGGYLQPGSPRPFDIGGPYGVQPVALPSASAVAAAPGQASLPPRVAPRFAQA